MKKYWELDKDPSEYLEEYAKRFGEETYQKELPYLLWDIEWIALDVKYCLEQGKTLSELFPEKYPIILDDDVEV